MLDGLFLLLALSVVMALASFLAGALPLSMTLSSSQLRLISTIGMGVLVGTSLVVIIPEGIEAIYSSGTEVHMHTKRSLQTRNLDIRWPSTGIHTFLQRDVLQPRAAEDLDIPELRSPEETSSTTTTTTYDPPQATKAPPPKDEKEGEGEEHHDPPTFYIGFSLITGFILMFLIDKLPRHASENLQPPPPTRHISLDNLSQGLHSTSISSGDEESDSFLQSLTPTPKQTRSLATTTGLVIHAAADGIAMGASASSSNTKLGFIIFIAIMIHKAPAAFGLTSVLLKQGLSKRAARGHLIIFSLAAPFGALMTWLLVHILGGAGHMEGERGQWWTGMLLLFSAGTFLYVAMHAMQEDSHHEHSHVASNGYADSALQRKKEKPQMRDTLAAVGGMLIPLLTQLGHHH
ncbi:Zinc/iron permease [Hyaloscypha variabilis F]|uniref:Zinc/iron permease n=1 Tax=Hyaloscypha variabilis (strain UAMH 11265 / GT02V1 / F) TaxID=1149755 RepID=A0A2J6RR83_HYAVF|nr:Zinc/iron permease [Hyaloscypha variabilis F]